MEAQSLYHQRLSGPLDYTLSDNIFQQYFQVKGHRLYYKAYDESQTVETIQKQYSYCNQGEELPLSSESVFIDKKMPLSEVTSLNCDKQGFQKILNKLVKGEAIQEEHFQEEEQPTIKKLIKKVQTHNIEVAMKQFQPFTLTVLLRNRPQFKESITYQVKALTTLQSIMEYVDNQAGSIIKVDRVLDSTGKKTYSSFKMYVSAMDLSYNSLIFEYPPVISISQHQQCIVRLKNSSLEQDFITLEIKANTSIEELVFRTQQFFEDQAQPVAVHDCYGNIIPENKWKYQFNELRLRKIQFLFIFPTYKNFNLNVSVINRINGPINFSYFAKGSTTLNDIVHQTRKQTRCYGSNFQISDNNGKLYGYQVRDEPFENLNFQEKQLKLTLIRPQGLIRSNTTLIVKEQSGKGYEQISIGQIMNSDKQSHYKVLCYNQDQNRAQFGQISCIRTEAQHTKLLSITVIQDNKPIKLECFEETTFLTSEFEWKTAKILKEEEKVVVTQSTLDEITTGTIVQIKQIDLEQKEELIAIDIEPHHNYFAGRIIVHNDNSIKIKAFVFENGHQQVKEHLVSCYLSVKIDSIQIFKGKTLVISGVRINNMLTFGDYQMNNFATVFVFGDDKSYNVGKYVISQWREKSYELGQVTAELKQKWQKHFLGVHESKLVELNSAQIDGYAKEKKPTLLLVGPKVNLDQLHYYLKIKPQYQSFQKFYCSEYEKKVPLPSHYINKPQNHLQNKDQIYPLYLYTTNQIFVSLNAFLRSSQKSNIEEMKRWFAITNCMVNSLQQLPNYSGVVYRGLRDRRIQHDFCITSNKDNERYLCMSGFSSTSTVKAVAEGFCGGKGIVITIRINSGKDIQGYSAYPGQKQILVPPYIYFMVVSSNTGPNVQTMELQQIPFPKTNKKKLIFWVDDVPTNNRGIIKSEFEPRGIEVVEVTSTRIMKIILRDFFGLFLALGKKIVVLSDMSRQQYGVWNNEAGVELFNLIYNEYGMSTKAIIYTGNQAKARNSIAAHGINPDNWTVTTCASVVVQQTLAQLQK